MGLVFDIIMYITAFIFAGGIIGFFGWYYFRDKERSKVDIDASIGIILDTSVSEGYAIGLQKSYKKGITRDRYVTTILGRDIDLDDDRNPIIDIPHPKSLRIDIVRGDQSQRRNLFWILPQHIKDLPIGIRKHTILGHTFKNMTALARLQEDFGEAMRRQDETLVESLQSNYLETALNDTKETIAKMVKEAMNQQQFNPKTQQ